jgi:hypothetical protein
MSTKAKLLELAESVFDEIQRTEKAYYDAERRRNETPQRHGFVDAEYNARAMRAEADYLAARDAYNKMRRNLPENTRSRLAALRREYAQEVGQAFAVDPSKLDTASMELLKSGIMKPGEYTAMMEAAKKAGNVTMVRIIAKYAAEAAEDVAKKYGEGDQKARELRAVGYAGNIDPSAAALETFDHVGEILNRCANNSRMIAHWDELAGPLLKMM